MESDSERGNAKPDEDCDESNQPLEAKLYRVFQIPIIGGQRTETRSYCGLICCTESRAPWLIEKRLDTLSPVVQV
jgi:hypothetical protein